MWHIWLEFSPTILWQILQTFPREEQQDLGLIFKFLSKKKSAFQNLVILFCEIIIRKKAVSAR